MKLVIIAIIASVKTLQLTRARTGNTKQKLSSVFTKEESILLTVLSKKYEGKTQKQKNPFLEENLAFGSWIIARLSGWKGYAASPAGPITMFDGLKKIEHIMEDIYK